MNPFAKAARDCLPPLALRTIRRLRGSTARFSGAYRSWSEAARDCPGYDSDHILRAVLDATRRVMDGEAVFERDSVLFHEDSYEWPVLAGLLFAAARDAGRLSVLDFGGSLGSSYFQHRRLLAALPRLRWSVVEQPHYVDAGRRHVQDGALRFHDDIASCVAAESPNVVLLSGVVQYLPDPWTVMDSLRAIGAHAIVMDRTIVNTGASDRLYVQHVPASIYRASYPCWSLSERVMLDRMQAGYALEQAFDSLPFPGLERIDSAFRGYLFRAVSR